MRVVVLLGGDSGEREISLISGEYVAKALAENGHEVIRIDPAANEAEQEKLNAGLPEYIHLKFPVFSLKPAHPGTGFLKNILAIKGMKPDIVFNALHGTHGEDGVIQSMMEIAGIPFTGSDSVPSMLAMNKELSKLVFDEAGLPQPKAQLLRTRNATRKKIRKLPLPQVVKPSDQGSTLGLTIVEKPEDMDQAVDRAFDFGSKVIVEEYIPGRELTVGILGERMLPIVEIKPTHAIYDYECKYQSGMSSYECPARLDEELTRTIQTLALRAHSALGCQGYSRVDFRLSPENKPYILEVNTLPGMTGTSLLPKAANAAGINFNALIEMIIEFGLEKYRL